MTVHLPNLAGLQLTSPNIDRLLPPMHPGVIERLLLNLFLETFGSFRACPNQRRFLVPAARSTTANRAASDTDQHASPSLGLRPRVAHFVAQLCANTVGKL